MDVLKAAKLSRETVVLAGLVAAAFCVRWYYTGFHPVMVPDYDGAEYIMHARDFLAGRQYYTIFIPPGMPVLISAALLLFKTPQTAGMFVSSVFGSLLCVAVYLFTKELFGGKPALLAGAMTACFSRLVIASTWVMSEMPFAFFLFIGFYAGLVFMRRRDLLSALAYGAIFGVSYLIRPEGFLFFLASGALIAAWGLYSTAEGKKAFLVRLALAVIVFTALCLPYLIYLKGELGRWTVSGKVEYNIAVNSRDASGKMGGAAEYVAKNIGPLIGKYRSQVPRLAEAVTSNYPPALMALAGLGLAVSFFAGRPRPVGFVCPLVILAYVCLLPFFFVDQRILAPYYTLPLIWAAVGWSFVEDRLLRLHPLRPAARFYPFSAALLLAFSVHYITAMNNQFHSAEQMEINNSTRQRYLVSGEWLNRHSAPGDKVLSRELLLVFYSGREYMNLPDLPSDRLWLLAKEKGARYVIVDDMCLVKRASLGPLLTPYFGKPGCTPGFTMQYSDVEGGVIIYRVEDKI